jgi:predicted ATP-grasp superfamily ATP-dependent carboligase
MYGKNALIRKTSYAARSRLVDRRYSVPDIRRDWQAGRIKMENTPVEESYVRVLLDICRREKIDCIFPTYDPQVYVLAKNRRRFEAQGVLIPIPDLEILLTALDKYRTARAAKESGFPGPRTCLPERAEDLERFAETVGPPWVVRPRFTAGSKGMIIVRNRDELTWRTRAVQEEYGMPMVQEYIPGGQKQNFYITADRHGEIVTVVCPRIARHSYRVYRNSSAAAIFDDRHELLPQIRSFVKSLGLWGAINIQTKIDIRDGVPKIMEINPRLGSHLWYCTELGLNEPLICIKIAKGEPVRAHYQGLNGTVLLDPIEDFIGFGYAVLDRLVYRWREAWSGQGRLDRDNGPMSIKALIDSYLSLYHPGNNKKYCPHFRYVLEDPLVTILWSVSSLRYTMANLRNLGI